MNNNAKAILQNAVISSATLIPIPSGRIGLFSNDFPYVVTYEKLDSSGKAILREIMLCTGKSGNNLVVTRAYEACPINDDAITQTQTSITLEAGGIIEARITGGILEEIKQSIEGKANDASVVHITGDESIEGSKNFSRDTLFIDDENEKVGVGTDTPAFKMDVKGDFGIADNFYGKFISQLGYSLLTKLSQGNATTGYQDIHYIPDYEKSGTKAGNVRVLYGFNSEINSYEFYSKISGLNRLLMSINDTLGTYIFSKLGIGVTNPTQALDVDGKIVMRSETVSGDTSNTIATKGYVDSLISGVGSDEEVVTLQAGETILSGKPISIGTNGLAYNMTAALGYYGISKNGASSGGSITVMKRGTLLLSAPKKIGSSTTLFTESNESVDYNIPDGGSRDYSFTPANDMLIETISVKKASPASQNTTRIGLEIRQGGTSLGTFFTGYSQATAFAVFTIGINLALTGGVTYTFRITKDPNSANPDGAIIKENAGSTMFTTSIVGRPFNVDMIIGDPLCLNSSLVYSGGGLNLPYVIGEMIGVNTFKILRGLQGGFISVGTGSNTASQAGYVYYNSGTATINGIGITGGAGYVKKGDVYTLSAGCWFSPLS